MVTTETLITDLIKDEPRAAAILAESGMNCIGCAASHGETVGQAAAEHGLDPVLLVRKLNLHLYHTFG